MDSRCVVAALLVAAGACVGCLDFPENVARLKSGVTAQDAASTPPSGPGGQAPQSDVPAKDARNDPVAEAPSSTERVPAADPVAAFPAADPASAVPPPAVASPVPVVAPGGPTAPGIELSAGVALPQTLPQGTVMTFGVDYRFADGGPDPGVRYVWVVEGRGKVERAEIPRLEVQGQLPGFFSRILTPNDEPFRSWIEAWPRSGSPERPPTGQRVSNIASMQ